MTTTTHEMATVGLDGISDPHNCGDTNTITDHYWGNEGVCVNCGYSRINLHKDTQAMTLLKTMVNLTPHTITLCREDGEVIVNIPSAGTVRASTNHRMHGTIANFPVTKMTFGNLCGVPLPKQQNGIWIILSRICIDALRASGDMRDDILTVGETLRKQVLMLGDDGNQLKDTNGNPMFTTTIIGTTNLVIM